MKTDGSTVIVKLEQADA